MIENVTKLMLLTDWPVMTEVMQLLRVITVTLMMTVTRTVSARQSWIRQPEYAEVNPGESVVLICIIANKEGDCR